jgi:predicted nucleic acid-binding protein
VIVVDASLAVKLYRKEIGSDEALTLIDAHAGFMSAPDIFAIEVAGAIVRDANINKRQPDENEDKLANFAALLASQTIRLVRANADDVIRAAQLAIKIGHPIKDCLYLALAMELGCDLVTCDARFAAKAKGVWGGVRVLGEVA